MLTYFIDWFDRANINLLTVFFVCAIGTVFFVIRIIWLRSQHRLVRKDILSYLLAIPAVVLVVGTIGLILLLSSLQSFGP